MIVRFANGTVEQQQLVREAIPGSIALSLPHTVTVEFVAVPGGSKDFFAYTTYTATTATVQLDTVFPNYPPPWDGEAFAREVVAHEFAHIMQGYLDDAGRDAICDIFTPVGTWEVPSWDQSVEEADAEQIKDALTIDGFSRRYTNRTIYRLAEDDFEAWRAIHNDRLRPPTAPSAGGPNGSWQVATLDNAVELVETNQEIPLSGGNIAHESVWTWVGTYDEFFGAYMLEGAVLPWRWRWATPPDPDHIPLLKQRTRTSFGGGPLSGGVQLDAPQEIITGEWSEWSTPLPTTHGSLEEMLFAAEDANPASLPWAWEFTLTLAYTQHPGDPPAPELEFEVLTPLVYWEPAGLGGEWVAPGESPPHPEPRRAAILAAVAELGRRQSRNRIVGRSFEVGPA